MPPRVDGAHRRSSVTMTPALPYVGRCGNRHHAAQRNVVAIHLGRSMAGVLQAAVRRIEALPEMRASRAFAAGDFALALNCWRPLAEAGRAHAQYAVGLIYYRGAGVPRDFSEAINWWRKAASRGNGQAQNALGIAYERGEGVPQDIGIAIEWYRRAAARGKASAQCNMGRLYEHGEGVPLDLHKAADWYRKAARRGDDVAQYNLGVMSRHGRGVPQSDAAMMKWWLKAADRGNADAEYNLGWMYDVGRHVPADIDAATEWYRIAADKGHAGAQSALGYLYARGDQIERDDEKSVKLLSAAAAQGRGGAMLTLAWLHAHGRGVPYDPLEVYVWTRLALVHLPPSDVESRDAAIEYRDWARSCLTPAQIAKARRLIKRWAPISSQISTPGVEGPSNARARRGKRRHGNAASTLFKGLNAKHRNSSRHAMWKYFNDWDYAQASDRALLDADPNKDQVLYAAALLRSNEEKAFPTLLAFAEQGSAWSMNQVAWCCFRGLGVASSMAEAEDWYRRAYEAGSGQGLLNYGRMLGRRGELELREAVYRVGADRGLAPAAYQLAKLRLQKSKTRQTLNEVRPLLELAAERGSPAASGLLAVNMARGRFGILEVPRGIRLMLKVVTDMLAKRDAEAKAAATTT
jgi:TPR repeat protein